MSIEITNENKSENMGDDNASSSEPINLKALLDKTLHMEVPVQDENGWKTITEEWKMDYMNDMDCPTSSANADYAAGKIKRRRFSSARVQPTRIKKVMQSDEEIGRMVASVPVAIGSAMEQFAERLLETASQCVQFSNCRTLSPMHIRYAVMTQPHLAFLESLMKDIPLPKFSSDYLESQSHMLSTQLRTSLLDPTLTSASTSEAATTPTNLKAVLETPFNFPIESYNNLAAADLMNFPMLNMNQIRPPVVEQNWNASFNNNIEDPPKRKRGRPRKVEKDRFITDPSLEEKKDLFLNFQQQQQPPFRNGHDLQLNATQTTTSPVKVDPDRLLMPPPAILPINRPRKSSDSSSPGVLLKPISLLTTSNNGGNQIPVTMNTENNTSNGEAKVADVVL